MAEKDIEKKVSKTTSSTGKRRGRPPKAETLAKREAEAKKKTTTSKTSNTTTTTTAPRRRGRPTKNETLAKREAELKEKIAAITKEKTSTIVMPKIEKVEKIEPKEKIEEIKLSEKIKEAEAKIENIKEYIEEKEEVKEELAISENPKDLVIDDIKLEKIEEEIEKQRKLPEDIQKNIYIKTFKNIIIGALIILYFIFINLGFYNINQSVYLTDLQVFSGVTLIATIVVFERAYKKDDDEKAIFGMELLVLSIATLSTLFIHQMFYNKFQYIVNAIAILFGLYYAIKSTVIYVKLKKKAKKENNDIRKIMKK